MLSPTIYCNLLLLTFTLTTSVTTLIITPMLMPMPMLMWSSLATPALVRLPRYCSASLRQSASLGKTCSRTDPHTRSPPGLAHPRGTSCRHIWKNNHPPDCGWVYLLMHSCVDVFEVDDDGCGRVCVCLFRLAALSILTCVRSLLVRSFQTLLLLQPYSIGPQKLETLASWKNGNQNPFFVFCPIYLVSEKALTLNRLVWS